MLSLPLVLACAPAPVDLSDTASSAATTPCTPRTFYPDADGDGWGVEDGAVEACEAPAGMAGQVGDCNDDDPAIHPEAREVCDDLMTDEDCDGLADDEDDSTSNDLKTRYYPDADGDGYGDANSDGMLLCRPDDTWSSLDISDCDDTDPEVHPGSTEVCFDDRDNDCDGAPLPCEGEVDLDARSWWIDGSEEGQAFGAAVAGADLDGDGQVDLLVADALGSVFLFRGAVSDGLHDTDAATVLRWRRPGQVTWGWRVDGGADLDGDWLADWAAAAPDVEAGEVVLLPGNAAGDLAPEDAPAILLGEKGGDAAGAALAATGDLDGDFWADLVVGAPEAGGTRGAVYLVRGPVAAGTATLPDAAWFTVEGEAAGDEAGSAVAVGDLDADGLPDLVVALPGALEKGDRIGLVGFGSFSVAGRYTPAEADFEIALPDPVEDPRLALAIPGDLDGDGEDDLAIGLPTADGGAGRVDLLLQGGWTRGDRRSPDASILGEPAAALGGSLASAGDLHGLGTVTLAIGGPETLVLAYPPLAPGSWTRAEVGVAGVVADALPEPALAGTGDVDGDGRPDLLVGRAIREGGRTVPAGQLQVLLGTPW